MWVSVRANVRVSSAARRSAREALQVSSFSFLHSIFLCHFYNIFLDMCTSYLAGNDFAFDKLNNFIFRLLFVLVAFLLWWLSGWLSLVLLFFTPPSMFG